jgi:hypothetical protein
MRANTADNPAIQPMEQGADMRLLVVVPPAPNKRVEVLHEFGGSDR